MFFSNFALATVLSACLALLRLVHADQRHFQATAIITNGNNHSEFQCWQLKAPITSIGGVVDTFNFQTINATYTVYPPRLNSGAHNAPGKVLSIYLSGLAHYSLPVPVHGNRSLDEFWLVGGERGTILSLDTEGQGHITDFPTDSSTVAFQVPLVDTPKHSIIGKGPCHFSNEGGTQLV